jgi:hypothetical protein
VYALGQKATWPTFLADKNTLLLSKLEAILKKDGTNVLNLNLFSHCCADRFVSGHFHHLLHIPF